MSTETPARRLTKKAQDRFCAEHNRHAPELPHEGVCADAFRAAYKPATTTLEPDAPKRERKRRTREVPIAEMTTAQLSEAISAVADTITAANFRLHSLRKEAQVRIDDLAKMIPAGSAAVPFATEGA